MYLKFRCTFLEKRQRAYKICGSQEKICYTPKTFRSAMLAHLQCISPSAGGTPCHLKKMFFGKKCLGIFFCIGAYICIGRQTLFLPYAGIFCYSLWLVIVIFFNSQNNCTCLFTHFKNITQLRESCDKIHCIPT